MKKICNVCTSIVYHVGLVFLKRWLNVLTSGTKKVLFGSFFSEKEIKLMDV